MSRPASSPVDVFDGIPNSTDMIAANLRRMADIPAARPVAACALLGSPVALAVFIANSPDDSSSATYGAAYGAAGPQITAAYTIIFALAFAVVLTFVPSESL